MRCVGGSKAGLWGAKREAGLRGAGKKPVCGALAEIQSVRCKWEVGLRVRRGVTTKRGAGGKLVCGEAGLWDASRSSKRARDRGRERKR